MGQSCDPNSSAQLGKVRRRTGSGSGGPPVAKRNRTRCSTGDTKRPKPVYICIDSDDDDNADDSEEGGVGLADKEVSNESKFVVERDDDLDDRTLESETELSASPQSDNSVDADTEDGKLESESHSGSGSSGIKISGQSGDMSIDTNEEYINVRTVLTTDLEFEDELMEPKVESHEEDRAVSEDSWAQVDVSGDDSIEIKLPRVIEKESSVDVSKPELESKADKEIIILDDGSSEEEERSSGNNNRQNEDRQSHSYGNNMEGKFQINCIARRTRSKLWLDKKFEVPDYTKYYKTSKDSDDETSWSDSSFSSHSSHERVRYRNRMATKQRKHIIRSESSSSSSGNEDEPDNTEADILIEESSKGNAENLMRKLRNEKKRGPKDESLLKMFLNTMTKDDPTVEDEVESPKKEWIPQELDEPNFPEISLFFSFGDDDPKPIEKTDSEKFVDELWADYDFLLSTIDIGLYNNEKDGTEQADSLMVDHSSSSCSQDNHFLVLDDEYGIVCKLCGKVMLEMRYIMPRFAVRPGGVWGKPLPADMENVSILDELCAKRNSDDPNYLSDALEGTVWDLVPPGVKNELYLHQQEGFEFMWRNVAGDIQLHKLRKSVNMDDIGGCVISHAPGTGKSRLTIVFLQSFMAVFPECRPVIIAPRGMLLMWEEEFRKWKVDIPFHLLNSEEFSGKEDPAALKLVRTKQRSSWCMRIVKLFSWTKSRSILGVSYSLYEKLVSQNYKRHTEYSQISKLLVERPGLFIFDEGHTPRNERSNIWKVLEKIKAERRIILSGTPFQNNFQELYNTLCLVRPKFAEKISASKSSYLVKNANNMYYKDAVREKGDGKENWNSLTSTINDRKLEELRNTISPFVHVHTGSILKHLPGLREYVLVLNPVPYQKTILERIKTIGHSQVFEREYTIALTAVHPSLFACCLLSGREEAMFDKRMSQKLRLDPSYGIKTKFTMELVRMSMALKEKVLIFSQYIEPLALVKEQLLSQFKWTEGREVLVMNGKFRLRQRQASIDHFNKPASEARVLLASIKACGEGITLTGASRVILLDVVWNPSVKNQAISRAFRIGQEKMVYTYNLLTHDTEEVSKYEKQNEKHRLSKLVFSTEGNTKIKNDTFDVSGDKIMLELLGNEKLKDMFQKGHSREVNFSND